MIEENRDIKINDGRYTESGMYIENLTIITGSNKPTESQRGQDQNAPNTSEPILTSPSQVEEPSDQINNIDPRKLFLLEVDFRQQNKQLFAGRRDLLKKACLSVGRDGFSAVVYGHKDIGKTSFAWRLLKLLSGDRTLSENGRLNLPPDPPNCKCVWLRCKDKMQNIEGVLLSLLKESKKPYTFSQEFPKVYNNDDFRDQIKEKYKIDLRTLSTAYLYNDDGMTNWTQQATSNIHFLFEDVMENCRYFYPDQRIIIFLDDYDVLTKLSGMGQLIRATDDAQFVIIGIADKLNEIIEDHQSASRKLFGSMFKISPFNQEEIKYVFDKAEEVSNCQIIFDGEFRKKVIFRSYGYPHLVQQLGCKTTEIILESSRVVNYPLTIGINNLQPAINNLCKDWENSGSYRFLLEILHGNEQAKKEILRIVAQETDDISDNSIMNKISDRFKKSVEENMKDLMKDLIEKLKVLKRVEDNRVRFRDPEARILTQVYFDSQQR
jgi:hypothetical protein